MAAVIIKVGHVQPVWAGHPWVFAQAIERIEGGAAAGDEILVRDARGNTLGRGLYSPGSAIPVRLFTRDANTPIDGALFASRIERAIARRAVLGLPSAQTRCAWCTPRAMICRAWSSTNSETSWPCKWAPSA
jgi:23S rRNA (cytosine1962-C5)-methyltransferase